MYIVQNSSIDTNCVFSSSGTAPFTMKGLTADPLY
jgi:hypothetical protein